MKKFFILFLILVPLAIAQPDLILQHSELQPYETLLGEIPAENFLTTLASSDIKFYQNSKRVFFDHDFYFYNNTYYISAIIAKPGNYTIKIENILYQDPSPQETTIEKEIFVKENRDKNNKTKILSISPGIIYTSMPENLTLSNKGTSELNITYNSETISIPPGNFKRILINPDKPFEYIEISTYKIFKIPVIYFAVQPPIQQVKLSSNPRSIKIKVNEGNSTEQQIELTNSGDNITDIQISTNLSIIKINSSINSILKDSKSNFTIIISPTEIGIFNGNITIAFGNKSLNIPVEISVFSKNVNINELQTCSEMGGIFCQENETCSEKFVESYDSPECCLGTCQKVQNGKSSYSWLIGLAILIVIAAGLYLIYKKFKITKPPEPEEQIKEKSKLYEKRVSGKLTKE